MTKLVDVPNLPKVKRDESQKLLISKLERMMAKRRSVCVDDEWDGGDERD